MCRSDGEVCSCRLVALSPPWLRQLYLIFIITVSIAIAIVIDMTSPVARDLLPIDLRNPLYFGKPPAMAVHHVTLAITSTPSPALLDLCPPVPLVQLLVLVPALRPYCKVSSASVATGKSRASWGPGKC